LTKKLLSQYADQEVLDLYEKCGSNATEAARQVGCGPSTFRERIALIKDPQYVSEKEKKTAIAFLMEELEARGIDPRDVNIKGAKVRTDKRAWEAMTKNEETQEAVVTPLKYDKRFVEIEFSPKWEDKGPEWPLIERAQQAPITYVPSSHVKQQKFAKRVFVIPDCQVGYYRNIQTMELTPFHDLKAIDVMLQMLRDYKPDHVVILGDFLDLASLSKYLQVAEFQLTLQPSIDYGYKLLAQIRSIVGPNCKIDALAGNHERRMAEWVSRNALAAYGIRRGGIPESWPVMSIPHLLRLDELGIEYSAEYPGGQVWITPKLVCTHQPPDKKRDLRASVIHGHTPHYRVEGHTVHYHGGIESYHTYSIPGLMRIDEVKDKTALVRTAVPSNRTRVSWTQGVATVNVVDEDLFKVEVHPISSTGVGIFQDRVYHSGVK
jgi:hypothetical protein